MQKTCEFEPNQLPSLVLNRVPQHHMSASVSTRTPRRKSVLYCGERFTQVLPGRRLAWGSTSEPGSSTEAKTQHLRDELNQQLSPPTTPSLTVTFKAESGFPHHFPLFNQLVHYRPTLHLILNARTGKRLMTDAKLQPTGVLALRIPPPTQGQQLVQGHFQACLQYNRLLSVSFLGQGPSLVFTGLNTTSAAKASKGILSKHSLT